MPGWAPTQGHIPSGVPYLGFALKDLTEGSLNRAMIVGKGSLFLGRMTNLFDGVSVVIERNPGVVEEEKSVSRDEIKSIIAKAMKDFGNHLIND
jgi:betaine reductase